jgi:O-succinylbenzoate synthase
MAKAAVEMAYWALRSEREEVSLAQLLGGTAERVPVGISLGIQSSPAALVERVGRAVEEGYRRIKVKVAPGEDAEFIAAVREAHGARLPLMVDANCAYTTDDLPALEALDREGLMMIEQPLAADDLLRHAALQARLATPICLDESITGPDRFADMLELDSGRIVNVKPGRVGGLGPSLAIHAAAVDAGVPIWCGGMLESGIGRAYNVALASLPGFTLPGDVSPSDRYWERDIVDPPWVMADGEVRVPRETPGLGVTVDRDRIDDLTVRTDTVAV